ncbi:MAG: hypothetical protein AAF363_18385 [Bacteroidota bacterium]
MAYKKKVTVKHFLNKKLPSEYLPDGSRGYQIYCRVRYDNIMKEVRSFYHIFQESSNIFEIDLIDYGYVAPNYKYGNEETFDSFIEGDAFEIEKSAIRTIVHKYLDNGINILKHDAGKIFHKECRSLIKIVDVFFRTLLYKDENCKKFGELSLRSRYSIEIPFIVDSRSLRSVGTADYNLPFNNFRITPPLSSEIETPFIKEFKLLFNDYELLIRELLKFFSKELDPEWKNSDDYILRYYQWTYYDLSDRFWQYLKAKTKITEEQILRFKNYIRNALNYVESIHYNP